MSLLLLLSNISALDDYQNRINIYSFDYVFGISWSER